MGSFGDKLKTSVGNYVWEIVIGVIKPMELLNTIVIESVVVKLTVLHQPVPFIPPRRNVLAIILVEILAKVCSGVPTLMQVGGEGSLLVVLPPECGAAVVTVCEDIVIVNIETYNTICVNSNTIR